MIYKFNLLTYTITFAVLKYPCHHFQMLFLLYFLCFLMFDRSNFLLFVWNIYFIFILQVKNYIDHYFSLPVSKMEQTPPLAQLSFHTSFPPCIHFRIAREMFFLECPLWFVLERKFFLAHHLIWKQKSTLVLKTSVWVHSHKSVHALRVGVCLRMCTDVHLFSSFLL